MVSALASSTRASAPTVSPSASASRSPTTSSVVGTWVSRPSRTTVEVDAVSLRSAATASAALASWARPIAALASSTMTITIASTGTPCAPSTTQATTEMATATSSR